MTAMTDEPFEPDLRRLREDERDALHELVSSRWASLADTAGQIPYVQGGLYTVTWVLSGLDRGRAERLAWLAQQMRFTLEELQVATAPSEIPGLVDTFYQVHVSRSVALLPDALLGEAQLLESLAVCWGLHLTALHVPSHHAADRAAARSGMGAMGRDIG
ncbi:hypothetical protein QRD43_19645 [Pelomonas sp. APW6]|uniref:Uncharacterized protein n=1 Tax=Roseateles subflavus TaxID=3053353 RepID=A0ABT7LMM7_9BURK|nr:hypothetical protein [Pelomonas sp. APW6]MDL5034123.1 hypothetical protein [Pelomonas sp. APW6]